MLLFKLVEEALGVGFEVSQAHKSVALNNKVVIFLIFILGDYSINILDEK